MLWFDIRGGGAHIIIIYFDNIFYLFLIFNRLSSNPYLLFFMYFMKLEHASFHRDTRLITIYSRSVFIYFDNVNNLKKNPNVEYNITNMIYIIHVSYP
jgi:hypothetical protein